MSSQILEFVDKTIADESAGSHGSSQVAGLTCQIFPRSRDQQPFFKQHHQTALHSTHSIEKLDNGVFQMMLTPLQTMLHPSRGKLFPDDPFSSFTVVLGSSGRLGYALICSNLMLSISILIPCCSSRVALVGFYQLF